MNDNEIVKLRHELHRLAELSGNEKKTAEYIENFLKSTKPDTLITGIGGHGIVAEYKSKKEGPAVLLRSELDALPIPEENDLEYISENEDTGHKCGHDGHMAIICGVARELAKKRPEAGTVYLLFQPAEETGEGAQRVLNDEKFQQIQPDYAFALHNLPGYTRGEIIVREGTFAAASVGCIIRLKGETSHAAHPEQGRSPALAMSHLVQSLSALPQFEAPLNQAAKVTVIHARLGERAFGTSPGVAEVMATLRTYEDDLLDRLKTKVKQLYENTAQMYSLDASLEWVEPFPSTVNDQQMAALIKKAAGQNDLQVSEKEHPFGWSEDFGHFTGRFTGALFGLGAGIDHPSLHAPDYDFPDEIITPGINMFLEIIDNIQTESV